MSAVPRFPAANDPDSLETQEWLDALEAVLEREGPERAHFLLERYHLFTARGARLRRGEVIHPPYPMQPVEVLVSRAGAAGFSGPPRR